MLCNVAYNNMCNDKGTLAVRANLIDTVCIVPDRADPILLNRNNHYSLQIPGMRKEQYWSFISDGERLFYMILKTRGKREEASSIP